jgi:hypothetical protein
VLLDVDHVFICVEDALAAQRVLGAFGLQFGRRVVHGGQGTANACVFFDNAYLELLWRHNDQDLQSEVVRPLALWERLRWRHTGASPFGIAFRPGDGIPVETWPYEAPFLPAGATIPIVTPRYAAHEPLVFMSLVSQAPATLRPDRQPPLEHRGGRRRLTGVTVSGPQASAWSRGIRMLSDLGVLALQESDEHRLELDWDGGRSGEFHDFRPTLPLLLRW